MFIKNTYNMNITFISDTHSKHHRLTNLEGGDILIFCGDFMTSGYRTDEFMDFIDWIKIQPYKYKVCIAGNHDRYCESFPSYTVKDMFEEYYDEGVRYVCDEMIEIEGLKIYGTPYQPYFCNWAFNVPDEEKLYNIYKQIPEDVDILITHCPPYDILDKSHVSRSFYLTTGEEPLGSKELAKVLDELGEHKPRYHAFGHIHGDGGKILELNGTTYINASVCNENYSPDNKIISLEIESK